MKKLTALILAGAMTLSLAACGGGGDDSGGGSGGGSTGGTESGGGSGSGGKVSFTIFNSKSELQQDWEELAKKYGEANNVDIEVYYSQDTVSAHLSTRYASKDPYTLVMVDAKDIYSVGKQYGYDMTGQDWVNKTDYAISVDGKVLGFPTCIEARGLLYNGDAIKEITGKDFDPSSIQNLDDFKALLEELVAGGMEKPTSILKPDWSLAAHFLQQVYEEREDVNGFVDSLYAGTADLANDEKFNALMDFFDVMMQYNVFGDSPIAAEDELVHQKLAEGEVAFQFGGCWEWNDLIDFDITDNVGQMAVPQPAGDPYNGYIVGGGSKYFYIDNSEWTTDEQRAAASDFLNYLVNTDEGKTFISDTCGMVSAFNDNTVPCSNKLGQCVKEFVDADKMVFNYDFDPDDHYSRTGASMQKYLAGQIDRAGLAKEVEDYWSSTTPVERPE